MSTINPAEPKWHKVKKEPDGIIHEGINWVTKDSPRPIPYCSKHRLPLKPIPRNDQFMTPREELATQLTCFECSSPYELSASFGRVLEYIEDKIASKEMVGKKFIDLDDESLVFLAKGARVEDKSGRYWIETKLIEHPKIGKRLMILVGDKEREGYTQIFQEIDLKRYGFDQSDLHPGEIFSIFQATFEDGSKTTHEKGDK